MEKLKEMDKVFRIIEEDREEIFQTLRELVMIPSVTGGEAEAQEYVKGLYSELGLETIEFEADYEKVSSHKAFAESGWDFSGRPNIIGILQGESSSKSLILNGNKNVVSPEPVAEWDFSPWGGEIMEGRLYGRGACDMKGGLLANYFALKSLLQAGLRPKGTVMLESVIEEEAGGGGGALACLLEGYTADGMVIPEPSMEITVASTGVYYFRVKATGKSAHAGSAHTGVNAVGKMNLLYDALVELDKKRAGEKHYPLFEMDSERSCHLNIGKYQAGDWPSTVAGWAEMECRISTIPGEEASEVKAQVHQAINNATAGDRWLSEHPPEVTWFGWNADPWEQEPEDPFVVTFKRNAERILEREVNIVGKTAGLDARFAQYFDLPALTFGPNGKNIHGVDEWVDLQSVIDCTKILASFIGDWCGI